MPGALEGTKVVELTTLITGPLAGQLLADLGAAVVKIENREGGDPFRNYHGGNYSGHFLAYNRNKRSITLDIRAERGKEILWALLRQADVLIDNFRPGVLDRLGFSPDKLRAANPKLIHGSITGFGHDGPYRDRPSYDAVAQALSGVLNQFLDPEKPQPAGPTLSDNISGYYLAYGILAALFERARTGEARRVETSMLEATMAFAPDAFINHKRFGLDVGPLSRVSTSQSYAFRCQDEKLIAIHLSNQQKFWEGLLAALERADVAEDPRFADRRDRIKNYKELRDELAGTFLSRPRQEWERRLQAEDVPYAPVLGPGEVFDDPQVRHLESFYAVEHPREGEVCGVNPPVWFDGARPGGGTIAPPPTLGEHTEAVLGELGFSGADIAALRSAKVI
jgi:crotonobetainyl-CoA:carnitine CoA-transferase CaiB-like acyl-CoA transferase